jgi:hypothetical protein
VAALIQCISATVRLFSLIPDDVRQGGLGYSASFKLYRLFTNPPVVNQNLLFLHFGHVESKSKQRISRMPSRKTALALDHVHCRAICDEIGERLRYTLRQDASDIPLRLIALIDKLAEMEQMPSIEETSSFGCFVLASRTRSADVALPATNRKSAFAVS